MNRLPKSLDMEETKEEQHGAWTAEDNKKHQHAGKTNITSNSKKISEEYKELNQQASRGVSGGGSALCDDLLSQKGIRSISFICLYISLGPGPTHNKNNRLENHRMPKHDNRFDSEENWFVSNENRFESSDHQRGFSQPDSSIPAIFPYEGKAAIMAEMDRQIQRESSIWNKDDPKKKDKIERSENEVLKAVEEDDLERIAEAHIDNTVEDDIQHARKSVKVNCYYYVIIIILVLSYYFYYVIIIIIFIIIIVIIIYILGGSSHG